MNQEIITKINKIMANNELDNIQKAHFELFGDFIEKAVYADNAQNRKLGRVGQEWHRKKSDKEIESFEEHGRAIGEQIKSQNEKLKRMAEANRAKRALFKRRKNEKKAQMMIKEYMDALEYDSDVSYMDYQYDNDVDLPQKVKEVFDVILSGGNEFVEAKNKVWDWTKIDQSEAWKEKMEKKGYSVADIDTGSDDIMFVAFKPKNLKNASKGNKEDTDNKAYIKALRKEIRELSKTSKDYGAMSRDHKNFKRLVELEAQLDEALKTKKSGKSSAKGNASKR